MAAAFEQLVFAPFTVAVSTNEIAHGSDYRFTNLPVRSADAGATLVVPRIGRHLHTGDYSIEGLTDMVCVERKTLEDLYGTLGNGRQRFEREVDRMTAMDYAAIVVEATWQEIARPHESRPGWRSKLDPRSVWGTVFAWSQRFPTVHWFTAGSRRMAEIMTFEILERYWREWQKQKAATEVAGEEL